MEYFRHTHRFSLGRPQSTEPRQGHVWHEYTLLNGSNTVRCGNVRNIQNKFVYTGHIYTNTCILGTQNKEGANMNKPSHWLAQMKALTTKLSSLYAFVQHDKSARTMIHTAREWTRRRASLDASISVSRTAEGAALDASMSVSMTAEETKQPRVPAPEGHSLSLLVTKDKDA